MEGLLFEAYPENAALNNPYACAYAPVRPNSPGSLLSFSVTRFVTSAISGAITSVNAKPITVSSAHNRHTSPAVLYLTNPSSTQNGSARTNPAVANNRGPHLSDNHPIKGPEN